MEEETTCPVRAVQVDAELPPAGNINPSLIQDKDTHPPADNVMAPNDLEDPPISTELLEILGVDPSITQEYGPDINKEVASRFAHIATSGLDKEIRKDLIKKFLVPNNCTSIDAPQLNLEIKAALTEQVVKRDRAIESRQKQMAAGLSALGKIISDQLLTEDKNNDLIKDLMEVGRIFCDIQHSESETRRNFTLYTVKKELKEQLSKTKIDKYLFGSNFTETLKTAKAVSKSSADLKPEAEKKSKTPTASTSRYLNWKARAPARRQPPAHPPRHLPPPAPQSAPQRGTSSHTYRQRPKHTRRQ